MPTDAEGMPLDEPDDYVEYTPEQARVAKYLSELTDGQVGAGEDPIGFLISPHRALVSERRKENK